jgi:hypothetical protein
VPATLSQLLADAATHFQNAQNALKAGKLGLYQSEVAAAQGDITQAQALSGATPTTVKP